MKWYSVFFIPVLLISGCINFGKENPLQTVSSVNLDQYMGQWYVIASIPSFLERKAFNAVQTYTPTKEGIQINYQFNDGGFNEELENYDFLGKIKNTDTNAEWDILFAWPLSADYNIIYQSPDKNISVVAHSSRDYAWILSRNKTIPNTTYSDLILFLQARGFNVGQLRKVPHQ